MKWVDATSTPPTHSDEVLVSDGYDSYAVAWYKVADETWHASDDMIEADNYDGGCHITIYDSDVLYWMEIKRCLKE